ncbi:MAG: hypothetical protein FJW94_08625 [Actinobacteria bacterium]|nr:hypothetical protein [Actinomycetota bacterium]
MRLRRRPPAGGAPHPHHRRQTELFDNWRHHAFITDHPGSAVDADADHRAHAVVELAILDRLRAVPQRC